MTIKPAPNHLSRAEFIAAFGGIYEHSPWVAETLFESGLTAQDADPAHSGQTHGRNRGYSRI